MLRNGEALSGCACLRKRRTPLLPPSRSYAFSVARVGLLVTARRVGRIFRLCGSLPQNWNILPAPFSSWRDISVLSFTTTAKAEYLASLSRSWQDFPVLRYTHTTKPSYPAISASSWQDIPVVLLPHTAKPENPAISSPTWQAFPVLSFGGTAKLEYPASSPGSWKDFPVVRYTQTAKPSYPAGFPRCGGTFCLCDYKSGAATPSRRARDQSWSGCCGREARSSPAAARRGA